MRRVGILFAVLMLAGCVDYGIPTVRWSKPGGTYDEFVADRAACVEKTRRESRPFILGGQQYGETTRGLVLDSSRFIPCMTAHGYSRDPKGFAAPPGDELPLAP
jgi:hypothetical protein